MQQTDALTWTTVILAVVNMIQTVALAYIASTKVKSVDTVTTKSTRGAGK